MSFCFMCCKTGLLTTHWESLWVIRYHSTATSFHDYANEDSIDDGHKRKIHEIYISKWLVHGFTIPSRQYRKIDSLNRASSLDRARVDIYIKEAIEYGHVSMCTLVAGAFELYISTMVERKREYLHVQRKSHWC